MSKKVIATTEDIMALMHKLVGDVHLGTLKEEINNQKLIGTQVESGELNEAGEPIMEDFQYYPLITPAHMTVIQKFLADSNITCNVEQGSELDEMSEKMKELKAKRNEKQTNVLDINKALNE